MSGPKLSAYELEQMRKAELERIQKEIIRIKALSMAQIQKAQNAIPTYEKELSRMRYQCDFIASSSLPTAEKDSVNQQIQAQIARVLELQEKCASICSTSLGKTLEEVQHAHTLIEKEAEICIRLNEEIQLNKSQYRHALAKLTDDQRQNFKTEGLSLEEALASLPPRRENTEKLSEQKGQLTERIYALLDDPLADEEMIERLQKALRRISETANERELHEIGSLVVGEMERKLKRIKPLLTEYLQLMSQKNALAVSLGVDQEVPQQKCIDFGKLSHLIEDLKKEIERLEMQFMQQAECEEIARGIDEAMEELGYNFVGKRQASGGSAQIKLFEFGRGTGLQVKHGQDGVIRIQVVGLANSERIPTDREEEQLYDEQKRFCDEYPEIVDAFRRKGIRMRTGTQKNRPADRQFSQIENVIDYTENYQSIELIDETEEVGTSKNMIKRKPKVLSKQ